MSTVFTFEKGPGLEFHYRALGINPKTEFSLHTNDELIDTIVFPFSESSISTVFHVHEVMRIVLSRINLTSRGDTFMAHSIAISNEFERLSYHAASVWKDWSIAVDNAGGSFKTILQRMFGVRIRQNGWWIPHSENKYIEVDDQWSIIDDIVTITLLLEKVTAEDLWISMDTGLRLLRNESNSVGSTESLSHFFGQKQRFTSASAWLKWSLENGTKKNLTELPSDQGTIYYYKGILDSEVPRYYPNSARNKGPEESDWWSKEVNSPDVPKFRINGQIWSFGIMWKYDEELEFWKHSYPFLIEIREECIVDISAAGLGLTINIEDITSDNELGPIKVRRSLRKHIFTEHLRAIRVLLIELGYAKTPSVEDRSIGGLGFSGSRVQSPFSDTYFLNPANGQNMGVVIGSPIETTIRREILKNNWYVI